MGGGGVWILYVLLDAECGFINTDRNYLVEENGTPTKAVLGKTV